MVWRIRDLVFGKDQVIKGVEGLILGRGRGSNIVIPNLEVRGEGGILYKHPRLVALADSISKSHAIINVGEDELYFTDNSTNGSSVGRYSKDFKGNDIFSNDISSPLPKGSGFPIRNGEIKPIYLGSGWPVLFYEDSDIPNGKYEVFYGPSSENVSSFGLRGAFKS
jgi:hypothetical protein